MQKIVFWVWYEGSVALRWQKHIMSFLLHRRLWKSNMIATITTICDILSHTSNKKITIIENWYLLVMILKNKSKFNRWGTTDVETRLNVLFKIECSKLKWWEPDVMQYTSETARLTVRRSCSWVFNSNCFCTASLSETSCWVRSLFALMVSLHFVSRTSKRFT